MLALILAFSAGFAQSWGERDAARMDWMTCLDRAGNNVAYVSPADIKRVFGKEYGNY